MEIDLCESSGQFRPSRDNRPRLDEPLPVRLLAVADVRLRTTWGLEDAMDRFYLDLLQFVRDMSIGSLVYRADNGCLLFDVVDAAVVERASLRPIGVEVTSLAEVEGRLSRAEIEYQRQHGITPGSECLLVRDPAGNWLEIVQRCEV